MANVLQVKGLVGQDVASFIWDGKKVGMIIDSLDPLDIELMHDFYNLKEWFDPKIEGYQDGDAHDNFDDFLNKIGPKLMEYCYAYDLS